MTFTLAHRTADQSTRLTHYRRALAVCQYVQGKVFDSADSLSVPLQPIEIPRLQRAIFTSGTIYFTLGPTNVERALHEYARSLELVIRPPPPQSDAEQYTLRDLLVAACVASHAMSSNGTGLPDCFDMLGSRQNDPSFDLLGKVRETGDQLLHALLLAGGGILPTPLLAPDQVTRLSVSLFGQSDGFLPSICTRNSQGELKKPADSVREQANGMTSTILLTLAKRFQDGALSSAPVPGSAGGLRVSTSLVILLYYIALAWSPAPSTYNNLGIVLSGVSETRQGSDGEVLDGVSFARMFYTEGLRLDPKHPHLLTNLGSLLKDQGQIDEAIK